MIKNMVKSFLGMVRCLKNGIAYAGGGIYRKKCEHSWRQKDTTW